MGRVEVPKRRAVDLTPAVMSSTLSWGHLQGRVSEWESSDVWGEEKVT